MIMRSQAIVDPIEKMLARASKAKIPPEFVRQHVAGLFQEGLHSKRVLSLGNSVIGVMNAESLSVQAIGHGLAVALDKDSKHTVKQVDRLLSNDGVDPWSLFEPWVAYVLAERTRAIVAIDWTHFEKDDQVTCAAHLITTHGRSTALVWKTVQYSKLRGKRTQIEDEVIERLHQVVPPHVEVTVLADRGFNDVARYDHLDILGCDYVIRFRQDILVEYKGETKPAKEWLLSNGRARKLVGAKVTGKHAEVGAVVIVRARGMKETWCLATSRKEDPATEIVKLYGRRFTIEETFRDQKDLRFGLGLAATHIRDCGRRDRLLLISAIAHALLTLLGAAAEAIGYDRKMKANTVKTRTHSLFRQGCYWFMRFPTMSNERLLPLVRAFKDQIAKHAVFRKLFGIL
jgi:hypothetical protein